MTALTNNNNNNNNGTSASKAGGKVLNYDSLNPHVKQAEYAVRGELAIRAEQLRHQLETGSGSLPFKQITNCNIGNPQQLGQKPISFLRQVTALLEYPALLDERNHDTVSKLFPSDAIARARTLQKSIGSLGSYSHSQGIPAIRKDVAEFIAKRDGVPADPSKIFLTAGASPGVQLVLQSLIAHENVGIMIPIPQYPLYTASIGLFNGRTVGYYLDEEDDWSLNAKEVLRSLREARDKGIDVRALCIINPGNPTGNIMSRKNMEEVIDVCHKERLVLLADEVYQTNVYVPEERPWHSFKKVLHSMGKEYEGFELISFHSISKGMVGECGRRGGYFECTGIDQRVMDEFYKVASISLCPNVHGQVAVDLMVKPPQPGDESYDLYNTEIKFSYHSLQRRAEKLSKAFNELEGVTCNRAEGAMYLFPRVRFSKRALAAAAAAKKVPDEFYSLKMLEATGVCVIPGSGFLQEPDTYHFRSTFLPPEDQFDNFIQLLKTFHEKFCDEYRD
ncbi:alanine transaminase [Sorochytrium milnesiophthora]